MSRAKELLDLAKHDAPSAAARDAMWSSIQTTTATAGASVALANASLASGGELAIAKGAGLLSAKLALGIALGASLAVGVATMVLVVTQSHAPSITHVVPAPRVLERQATVDRASSAQTPEALVITGHVASDVDDHVDVLKVEAPAANTATRNGSVVLSEHDRLAREARMVSEARGALRRGEPDAALRIVRNARTQPGARMVPEELTIEAQILRAMGDETGAKRALEELAGKFPEQALAH